MDIEAKVLIVDDDEALRELFCEVVADMGYQHLQACDGMEAFNIVVHQSDSIAAVVSDYQMPNAHGLELRTNMLKEYADIPFVLISGILDKAIFESALNLRVEKILAKPINVDEFRGVLGTILPERLKAMEEKMVLVQIYIQEAQDLMEELEPLILELETKVGDTDTINSIFRLVHTIKGGSSVIEWPEMTKFIHHYESCFSRLKSSAGHASPDTVSILLKGFDFLDSIMTAVYRRERIEIELSHWESLFTNMGITSADQAAAKVDIEKQPQGGDTRQAKQDSIRVPTETLNHFMELSGEITMIRSSVNRLVMAIERKLPGDNDVVLLDEFLDEMNKINSGIQNQITELRKVPVHSILRSYSRTIRDLSNTLKKPLKLETEGDDLKVDEKIAHTLRNALIHVVRNCADHGIESPQVRSEAGKPNEGTIKIAAAGDRENVTVIVSDDGGGINAEKIGSIAVSKGLYTQEEVDEFDEERIFSILMEPGFSTSQTITDISGRGVGMDMVKSSLESIGGKVKIQSTLGEGSRFIFSMPIPKSVTIIGTLLVLSEERLISIPQDNIIRLLRVSDIQRAEYIVDAQDSELLNLDDELLPIVRLNDILYPSSKGQEPSEKLKSGGLNFVVLKSENTRFALEVDEILDAEEAVLRKMEPFSNSNQLFLGATFLGDGSVGLILDVDGISEYAKFSNNVEEDQTTDLVEDQATKEYLMLALHRPGSYAVELDWVHRLEEFNLDEIKTVSGKLCIIYRDLVVPLYFFLEDVSDLRTLHEKVTSKKCSAIIVNTLQGFVGYIIAEIKDVKRTSAEVALGENRPGILGQIIEGGDIVSILDAPEELLKHGYELADSMNPQEDPVQSPQELSLSQFESLPPASEASQDSSNNEATDTAAGFGIF